MKPKRIFIYLCKILKSDFQIQLPSISAQKLIDLGLVKSINVKQQCSLGKFTCTFHELTDKGLEYFDNYCIKNKIN